MDLPVRPRASNAHKPRLRPSSWFGYFDEHGNAQPYWRVIWKGQFASVAMSLSDALDYAAFLLAVEEAVA